MKVHTLGILGGGQLAQMLSLAAIPLGVRCVVLEPDPQAPARLSAEHLQAAYTDAAGLDRLAQCDAVTLEFENVPTEATAALQGRVPLRPSPDVLHLSKHRAREKAALVAAGAEVAPYVVIEQAADLSGALKTVGGTGILKTSELGYDGKGQARIGSAAELRAAWKEMNGVPCVLEGLVPFVREVSLGVARGQDGTVSYGPLVENVHAGGILRRSIFPAASSAAPGGVGTEQHARRIARAVAEAWDVVGLITLEFFELPGGELLVNEVAPRVHNSGHLTQDGGGVSQFEAAVRAALGLPLQDFGPLLPCGMVNILGWEEGHEPDWDALDCLRGTRLHWYHKANRPGRKVGHVNVVGESREEVQSRMEAVERVLEGRRD
ncbi:5-(carboxyamino)imidazole ribonucleotide synthase [Deinococcus sp. KNUC1210]|uniref:5-(carboxyamino)imidazole ribonucleotide synthase n=1 Tax=Deinococcus sp. KNUC1210 TaxID=2917691 RepID=UPI001EEF80B5|nr:5-(carboxyamino)imidazole ribonucleotide synthase [Deinococcus sp. KNUC1210]ULH15105.1 5-(carboxyamino)imidazole ribonucleotide synthase [Deinococcus sp. KNUC1210]